MMKTLKEFVALETSNFFTADLGLQDVLNFVCDNAEKDRLFSVLSKWEKNLPRWNELANEAARPEKLPRVEKYDRVGNRIEKIVLPLETKTIRKEVVQEGIYNNKSEIEFFSKVYLLAELGESGIMCPLACTDGLMRVIQTLGSDFLKKEYLPKLSSTEYPLSGAQFITEQAGGSDVGAIEGVAKENKDGTWSITAEKWYCSAADEFYLLLARPEGAIEGTKGLALYFVPRLIKVGDQLKPNNLSIKGLKDKLGTQSIPTAEIDFEGSVAYLIGKKEEGFYGLMNYILNVSRTHNAANALGIHRRAFTEARNYAEQRIAFGNIIIHYPMIQEYLVSLLSHLTAKRNFYFSLVKNIDTNGLLPDAHEQRLWQRFLINLTKYRTSFEITDRVKEAILIFGANGIVQDFSIVPRLLRDSLIVETWEGAHNILCLQIMRDGTKFDFTGRLKKEVKAYLDLWPENSLPKARKIYAQAYEKGLTLLDTKKLTDIKWVQTHAKHFVNHFASLLEIGNLVKQGFSQNKKSYLLQASYLTHTDFIGSASVFENPVINQLDKIGLDLIREKDVDVKLEEFY